MSFKAVILLKNREAVIVNANATKTHFKFGKGIYIITESDIQNVQKDGKILGAEAIYFEGNPNAVGSKKIADGSGKYLDEIVIKNALKQTSAGPKFNLDFLSFLAPLKNPINLLYILFAFIIVYGLVAGALGWV